MKHIKTYEKMKYGALKRIILLGEIDRYLENDDNFSERNNIKEIFQDVFDWYYLNKLNIPNNMTIFNEIYRISDNSPHVINIKEDIKFSYDGDLFGDPIIYYKSYRIFIPSYDQSLVLNEKVNLSIKRLNNSGFRTMKQPSGASLYLHILDPNDPITLKEIEAK